jgi:hypothetical protein
LPASANGGTSSAAAVAVAVAVCTAPAIHDDCRLLRADSRPGSSPSRLNE